MKLMRSNVVLIWVASVMSLIEIWTPAVTMLMTEAAVPTPSILQT